MTDWMPMLAAALLGAALGSFLNVTIYRLPEGLSVVTPRSRCPACATPIAWYDNVPVLSWLVLRGRCRSCSAPISVQYPLIELATAAIWLAVVAGYGATLEAARSGTFLTLLLAIAMTDARAMVIPDHFSLGGLVAGLGFAAMPGGFPLRRALIGAAVAYILLWGVALGGERLFKKPALGVGDIHMMAMVGAFVGLSGALLTVLFGSVLALAIGVPLMWLRGRRTVLGTYLPLGTFLALGGAIAHTWGDAIVAWYLHTIVGI